MEVMCETLRKIPPQVMHALSAKHLHERPKRKLIQLAAPVFDPAQVGFRRTIVLDRDLRKQHRISAEGRKDCLIDPVSVTGALFAEIADPEYPFETLSVSRIKR